MLVSSVANGSLYLAKAQEYNEILVLHVYGSPYSMGFVMYSRTLFMGHGMYSRTLWGMACTVEHSMGYGMYSRTLYVVWHVQ